MRQQYRRTNPGFLAAGLSSEGPWSTHWQCGFVQAEQGRFAFIGKRKVLSYMFSSIFQSYVSLAVSFINFVHFSRWCAREEGARS